MMRSDQSCVTGTGRGLLLASLVALLTAVPGRDASAQGVLDAEAVVVGAGISGLAAAVEMGRAGVAVRVVDMNSVMGGHAVMAGGFAIAATPLQARLGYDDSPELAFADWQTWTVDGNPEWTRFYAENSRAMIYDWLAEMNVEFVRVQGGWENSVPRFHFTPRGALDVVRALYREALRMPNIAFDWNENVEHLVVDGDRVAGIVTRNLRTGAERTLRSRHIVLATGGFAGNLERVLANWRTDLPRPDRLLIGASIHARGAGLDLATDAGASLKWINRHYIYTNGMVDPHDPAHQLAITGGNDDALWVNTEGRRFTNEGGYDKRILADLMAQDDTSYWAIFDNGSRGEFSGRGREWINNRGEGHPVLDNPDATIKADTLAALAREAGLPVEAVQASVARFNALIAAGRDEDFGRFDSRAAAPPPIDEPPYYAIHFFPMPRKSMGGVAVDLETRALDGSGEPVPGLYAVGELTGSVGINGTHGMDGMFLGPALVTGRVAGQTIAAAHAALAEPLTIAARAAEQPLPDPATWTPGLDADALRALLSVERDGYWHFQISHALVLERGYDCVMCHSAKVPFAPVANTEHKLAQVGVCGNCHGR
jgi:predicted oxidoreductase